MAKSFVIQHDVSEVERWLHRHPDLAHIRVRKRGSLIILESGPDNDPVKHARLRRTEVGLWALEMPYRSGWQSTPFLDPEKEPLLELLHDDFGWTLMPIA